MSQKWTFPHSGINKDLILLLHLQNGNLEEKKLVFYILVASFLLRIIVFWAQKKNILVPLPLLWKRLPTMCAWAKQTDLCMCTRTCSRVFICRSGGRGRGHVPKITKSVWQLTVLGFWLKFVDMTSSWVCPKRTPGIPGCLPALQTEQPVSWQNQAVQGPSPPRRPYLPAESLVIRVWPTCGW